MTPVRDPFTWWYGIFGIVASLVIIAFSYHWSLLWTISEALAIGEAPTVYKYSQAVSELKKSKSLGLLQKLNWLLYPLFFLLVSWLVGVTWNSFITAWKGLERNRVIRYVSSDSGDFIIFDRLSQWRRYCILVALVIGVSISFVDAGCLAREYASESVIGIWPVFSTTECPPETDFFTAYQRPGDYGGLPADFMTTNMLYAIAWYVLQALLVSGGFLALFQICFHQVVFMLLRGRRSWRTWGLARPARMDPFDRLREFGLHSWNHVMNYSYFAIAMCMIIPIISHWYQPDEAPDIGQVMLQIFLPLIFLVPIVLGVVARQLYLDDVKRRIANVAKRLSSDQIALFHDQALWPFDRSILGKGAFSVILIEYGIVASNAHSLIRQSIAGLP